MRQIREQGIEPIDLVAINLYPFEETVRRRGEELAEVIEMIDIGGPAMIRSASKNFADVTVVVDPRDYPTVLAEVRVRGSVSDATRLSLAARAFAHTAAYDCLIADYLSQRAAGPDAAPFPDILPLAFSKAIDLRYGENPHQRAALYLDPIERIPSAVTAQKIQGKDLSFNNILDLDAAWSLVCDFEQPACAIIKHTNPAGTALGADAAEAFERALAADPVSAFGGIVACNRQIGADAARAMASIFLEAVIAPDFSAEAREILKGKKNLRVMRTGSAVRISEGRDYKRVAGGLLVQDRDRSAEGPGDLKVVTRRAPSGPEIESLIFAWTVVRHVKSNAIVYARGTVTAGVGAGQMSRVDSVKFGAAKAVVPLKGCVLASDAFFPFRDGVDEAARAGVTAIVQPGGSVKDAEVIAAADEHGIAMVFTGRRHFRH
jgi:phosphoribosylaminoimidazolecarboxamide formyltransferase/IMP cyclohydrolase